MPWLHCWQQCVNNHGQVDTAAQCLVLNILDQPLKRYWSVCLPQCVYWLTLPDDDAEDIVEVAEFDESFLLMPPRVGQRLVDADCGEP